MKVFSTTVQPWLNLTRRNLIASLAQAHTGLNNVYDIVAKLLALLDNVHVHSADGVSVLVVVDIIDVLALELIAEVVYLVLDVERAVGVKLILMPYQCDIHLYKGVVRKLEHLMNMLVLAWDKVFLTLHLPVDGARNVLAAVTDTLYLGNLPEHGPYLGLGVIAEVCVADLVEVFGNLYLHAVGDALVLLYTRE